MRTRVGDLAHPLLLAANVDTTAQAGLHGLGIFRALLRRLRSHVDVLDSLQFVAEGVEGVDHGAVAGLGGGVVCEGLGCVVEGVGPHFGRSRSGRAWVLVAEAVGQRVDEDGVDGARGAVHGVFDDRDDAVDRVDDVIGEARGRVLEEGEDGFCAALEADAAVAVADDGVVAGDQRLGRDDATEAGAQNFPEHGGVH